MCACACVIKYSVLYFWMKSYIFKIFFHGETCGDFIYIISLFQHICVSVHKKYFRVKEC